MVNDPITNDLPRLGTTMDNLQPDDIVLGVRQRRKQSDPIPCPVCGVTVRPADMEQHYAIEVDRLHKLQSTNRYQKRMSLGQMKDTVVASTSSGPSTGSTSHPSGVASSSADAFDPKECWNTYQRIKNNRQARLKVTGM